MLITLAATGAYAKTKYVQTPVAGTIPVEALSVQNLPFQKKPIKTIVVYGDSISAAYGMNASEGWVSLLTARLNTQRPSEYQVINASVSGETTGGGLTRLPKTLEVHQPDILILELGANDGLRGYPIDRMTSNLNTMVNLAHSAETQVLLVGMVLPPNYGQRYTTAFESMFTDIAAKHAIPLVPFLLDGATTDRALIQRDGLHPTADAQPKLLNDIWPSLLPML